MKKVIIFILCVFMGMMVINNVKAQDEMIMEKNIQDKLIRFHVIANTDTKEDQNLKLKVKDEVIKYIQPKLENCKSINESREVLKKNDSKIIKIAENIIKQEGFDYDVKSSLSKENFPIKTYGNITLPAGEYEAYRIIIGNGKGHNWWCVMFPPLCFVDITRGEVSYNKTESEMKKVLSKDEYNLVDNTCKEEIKLKFKLLDIIRSLR
ncbi:stage II sporulation protein R [Haloimpatiens sp. FM7315]|uniref:stage II sporulation protein R n=1 Tax=Haloimpatiens sp. FM7315 TaxID=3298609 RepID=UPI0035A370E8